MKIETSLNGTTYVKVLKRKYNILNFQEIEKSDDGFFRYIYYIFDKKTRRYYIGEHRTLDLNDSYAGSGSLILEAYENAKAELGENWEERFTKCIIKCAKSEEELNFLEERIVNDYVKNDIMSYNCVNGGKSGYKSSNSIEVYQYDLNGKLLQKFSSISQASMWAIAHINIKTNVSNCISAIASCIKQRRYKYNEYYWTDFEINNWDDFLIELSKIKESRRVSKNLPIVLIDKETKEKKIFSNRKEAAIWLIDTGYTETESIKQVLKSLGDSARDNRASYGFIVKNYNFSVEHDIKSGALLLKSNAAITKLMNLRDYIKAIMKNANYDFEYIIELSEKQYETMLSTAIMFNTQHNIKSDIIKMNETFEFGGVQFRRNKDIEKSRIVVEMPEFK